MVLCCAQAPSMGLSSLGGLPLAGCAVHVPQPARSRLRWSPCNTAGRESRHMDADSHQ